MNETPLIQATVSAPARKWRRWRTLLFLAGVPVLACIGIVLWVLLAEPDLQRAVAEADRLDPGWRLEELEAARETVADEENSALMVLAASRLLPNNWLATPPGGRGLYEVLEEIGKTLPAHRLTQKLAERIRAELGSVTAARDALRKIAGLPRGRYPIAWAGVDTMLTHIQIARDVEPVLELDALCRIEKGDLQGALVSCRALLNLGRSFGDEATMFSHHVRLTCRRIALHALERILAQGEKESEQLADFQRLLEQEAEFPLLLAIARADRAWMHAWLETAGAGKLNRASLGMAASPLGGTADRLIDKASARASHGGYLRYLTEVVEIAKLPPEQQHARWRELEEPKMGFPPSLRFFRDFGGRAMSAAYYAGLGRLRCAIAAVAMERYRLEERRWPETLEDLIPRYLSAVPNDPYDGQPLRLARTKEGLVVYCLGPDFADNGGRLARDNFTTPATDVGFELWSVENRRQAEAE
jgi:hypothetical protein